MTSTEYDFVDITGVASSVAEAVRTRHSVRDFESKPVDEKILTELFSQALRAPSWKNSQPWKIHVVSGERKNRMARLLTERAKQAEPSPDTIWPSGFPSDAKRRMFDLGMKIYGVAGIERKDKEARDGFMLRNFEFFGAPTAVFITTEFELNFYIALDIGCLLNTVMLLARSYGLGSVPQAALSAFPETVRAELGLSESEKVVCGLSLGYPKADSDLNLFHTPREPVSDLVRFY
ncbi:nitroreductase [Leptospira gomenensis]|uniref:Nitroreductase n=1 Tax=Leptospira gomenensis TaxID=2484974 RepID=A0A5F1YIL9_9LEPT|nr:nitroreductase [Leptospira gomenensis]TGK38461.1 nitroreductase [Leptospira gomenensis]TGK42576.1 nitroreductase [Leptospira gomenensis]TGK45501.1 nitroreductase [Leptospira gomenensis]TGK55824.1 nitroreductase [Leptospira gomenensis]